MYTSFGDFVSIALLLPFGLGFCLVFFIFFFFSIHFSDCYHWSICFLVLLLPSFFLSFFFCFYYFLIYLFLIIFNNFLFILFFSFFLSFLLPFHLSHMADRVLVHWPGVNHVPLKWESRVQDIRPPENSWLHVISNGKRAPRELHHNSNTQLHSTTSKLQCCTPYAKQVANQEHNPTH